MGITVSNVVESDAPFARSCTRCGGWLAVRRDADVTPLGPRCAEGCQLTPAEILALVELAALDEDIAGGRNG